jgi:hypothetical protein
VVASVFSFALIKCVLAKHGKAARSVIAPNCRSTLVVDNQLETNNFPHETVPLGQGSA